MNNAIFVGPYRQADGWGAASRDYIKSLSTVYNLKIHPIYYIGNIEPDISPFFLELENKNIDCDILIQKCLPGDFYYDKSFSKNIALTETEVCGWKQCPRSLRNLNQMDEIWVPSTFEKIHLEKAGLTTKIKAISQPLDIETINSNRDVLYQFPKNMDRYFKFYFIGENVERKNLMDLIQAFHMTFKYNEDVILVIKTSLLGVSDPNQAKAQIYKYTDTVKKQLHIRGKLKKEFIITERLPYKDIIGLHNACDCFVMPSNGEAFCRPAAEALVLGKTPIVNKNSGMSDYINDVNGYLLKSTKQPVILANRGLSDDYDFYNASQYWYHVDIYDLCEKLRYVYDARNSDAHKNKQGVGTSLSEHFSYATIGSNICT